VSEPDNDNQVHDDSIAETVHESSSVEHTVEDKLALLQKENDELRDKFLRTYAEFDNFKKRSLREKLDLLSTAAQDTIKSLLPVLDDFDRAKRMAEHGDSKEPFPEGVNLVYHKLYNTLKNLGLEEMDTTGQGFDPEFHEAITEIPAPTADLKGKVVDTIEKGYKIKDKIIRHAKVVVGN
jgi:molecular chaperone GrpE